MRHATCNMRSSTRLTPDKVREGRQQLGLNTEEQKPAKAQHSLSGNRCAGDEAQRQILPKHMDKYLLSVAAF